MILNKARISICLLFACGSSYAQVDCRKFEAAMELSAKRVALSFVTGIGEGSPQKATHNLDIMAELQLVSINQALAAANGCPPRKTPMDPYVYSGEALACKLQHAKGKPLGGACEINNWKGER